MTLAEALDTTRLHRVAGLAGDRTALVTTCPLPVKPAIPPPFTRDSIDGQTIRDRHHVDTISPASSTSPRWPHTTRGR